MQVEEDEESWGPGITVTSPCGGEASGGAKGGWRGGPVTS